MYADNASFDGSQRGGGLVNNGQLWIGSSSLPNVNTGFITYQQAGSTSVGTIDNGPGTIAVEDRSWLTRYVVDPTGTIGLRGTYQSISAAIAQAIADGGSNSNPKTIFIRPGTYTENPTLNAGVNLCAFPTDSGMFQNGATVVINGKCTFTQAGQVNLSGIMLQTNGDFALSMTGSNLSSIYLNNCNINATNHTAIQNSNSNSSSQLYLHYCTGNIGATGIAIIAHSSTGTTEFYWCYFFNSGGSTTASTCSAGTLNILYCSFTICFTYYGSTGGTIEFCQVDTSGINTTSFVINSSNVIAIKFCNVISGSAACISVGGSLYVTQCDLNTSNTNSITGSGTVSFTGLSFHDNTAINTSSQSGGVATGISNPVSGLPSAGFLGEQIRSYVSAQSIITATPTNVTSISLTPGVWDISSVFQTVDASFVITFVQVAITTGSATFVGTNLGDNSIQFANNTTSTADLALTIPSYRVILTTTTTYNLVGQMNAASGTLLVSARISATRVG
jgi:hypothetical protein